MSDLVVANSWGEGEDHDDSLAESAKDWRTKNEDKIFVASNCAHRLWIGSSTTFSDFPEDGNKNLDILSGKEAYVLMLRMLSGIESPILCETHVRSQFKDKWRVYKNSHPDRALALEDLYGQMMKDSGYISDKILSHYKGLKHELSARDISGQVKGDKVLIVADLNRHGHVAQYTERMIHVSENKQNGSGSFLTLTHPDPAVLEKVKEGIDFLSSQKKVRSEITYMPFEDISRAFEENDRVYVDTSMGDNIEADLEVIEAWKNRVRDDNTMVHMRGNPQGRGLSNDMWEEAGLENYFGPEDIYKDIALRKKMNPEVILHAEKAIEIFSIVRVLDKSPTKRVLAATAPEVFVEPPAYVVS